MTLDQQQRLEYFLGTDIGYIDGNEVVFYKYKMIDYDSIRDIIPNVVVECEPPKQFRTTTGIHYYRPKTPRLTITAILNETEFIDHVNYLIDYYDTLHLHHRQTLGNARNH